MTTELMSRSDRETLIKIARQRERVAKTEAKERAAQLSADFEMQLDTRYRYDSNDVWKEAHEAAKKAVKDAQALVAQECNRLGIPEDFAPSINIGWFDSGRQSCKKERAEMRRVASAQIDMMLKQACTAIERRSLETQEKIMVGGLTSDDARKFLEAMPTVDTLMPTLTMEKVETLLLAGSKS